MSDKEDAPSQEKSDAATTNTNSSTDSNNILECSTCKKQYSTAAAREKHKCPWCSQCQRLYSTYQKYQQHKIKCAEKVKAQTYVTGASNIDNIYKSLFNEKKSSRRPRKQSPPSPQKVPKNNFESTANMLKALGTDIKPIQSESQNAAVNSIDVLASQQNLVQMIVWRQLMTMMLASGMTADQSFPGLPDFMNHQPDKPASLASSNDTSTSSEASINDLKHNLDEATPSESQDSSEMMDNLRRYLLFKQSLASIKDYEVFQNQLYSSGLNLDMHMLNGASSDSLGSRNLEINGTSEEALQNPFNRTDSLQLLIQEDHQMTKKKRIK